MNTIYVVGTKCRQKIYSAQFGWVKPDDNHHIISSLIFGRHAAEETRQKLSALPCCADTELVVVPVKLSIGTEVGT